jgi:hypothetical protein
MATLAFFVAVGGSAYAGVTLQNNSVKSPQIAPGAVKTSDLGANAVTSPKVKNRSLLAVDFKAGQLPAGTKGDPGANGAKGDKGDVGPRGPSNGFEFRKASDFIAADPGSTSKVLGTLSLPAGKFILHAEALVGANTQSGFVDCVLTQAATTIDQSQFYLPTGGGAGSPSDEAAVLSGGIDLPGGGNVNLTCQRANAQTLGVFVDDINITAVQVETLTTTG